MIGEMKRREFLRYLMWALALPATGCGSSNNQKEAASNALSIKDGFWEVSKYEEKITIAVNDSYVNNFPNYQRKLKDAVDFINVVLNRNEKNQKWFSIGKIEMYADKDITSIYDGGVKNKKFIFDNKFPFSYGTTLVLFIASEEGRKPRPFDGSVSSAFQRTEILEDGRKLETIYIADNAFSQYGSPFTDLVPGTKQYEWRAACLLHEFGHAMGLAEEELYRYYFGDSSGVLPKLPDYYPWLQAKELINDPMVEVAMPFKFSELNSQIINGNAEHTFDKDQIMQGIPHVIRVRVVDENGNSVKDATVKVFAALWGDLWTNRKIEEPIPLLEITTNCFGGAQIDSDDFEVSTYKGLTFTHRFSRNLAAKIIKASFDGKYAGAYLTLYDLEKAYLYDKQDELIIELMLTEAEPEMKAGQLAIEPEIDGSIYEKIDPNLELEATVYWKRN